MSQGNATISHYHFHFSSFDSIPKCEQSRIITLHANCCFLFISIFLLMSFRIYLYPYRSDNMIDHRATLQSDNKARIDYSVDPNAMGMRMQHTNTVRGRYTIGTIHGTFCRSASSDRRIVSPSTPYTGHRRAYNAMDTMCTLTDQLL